MNGIDTGTILIIMAMAAYIAWDIKDKDRGAFGRVLIFVFLVSVIFWIFNLGFEAWER